MIDPHTLLGPSARRRAALAVTMWVFGVATTVLLIGMWGRTVSGDEPALAEGARAVIEAEVIAGQVEDWVADGIAASSGIAAGDVVDALAGIGDTPQAHQAVTSIVEQAVGVALAEPGSTVAIEVRSALAPLAPVIGQRLRESGVPAEQKEVEAVIAGMPDLVLSSGVESGIVGAATRAHTLLTRVVVVSGLALLLSAAAAVALAEDRLRTLRTLVVRVAVSALTFAVILRLGAWALDPEGGRSPVAAGGAVLLRSNGLLLPLLAAANLAAAVAITAAVRHRRNGLLGA